MTTTFKINAKYSKDTFADVWVLHSVKYDISGYGTTKGHAKKSFENTLNEILLYSKKKIAKIK